MNRRHDLARFEASSVRWAECDVRLAPTGQIVASHSSGTKGDRLRAARPQARRSVPVDTFAAWLLVAPAPGLAVLRELRAWGIDRVSISVQTQMFQEVAETLKQEEWLVNIWDVSDSTQLRDAIAARPASITPDLGILRPPRCSPGTTPPT